MVRTTDLVPHVFGDRLLARRVGPYINGGHVFAEPVEPEPVIVIVPARVVLKREMNRVAVHALTRFAGGDRTALVAGDDKDDVLVPREAQIPQSCIPRTCACK